MTAFVDRVAKKNKRIDISFNVISFGDIQQPLMDIDVNDFTQPISLATRTHFLTTRAAATHMIKQRSGHIINMGSMAGLVATPTYTIYAASKHAVHGFSEALRREVKPWGIDVSMLYPGGVKTEFGEHAGIKRKTKATTPKFLLLSAEDVARAVLGLVRRPRAMLIIPWLWSVTVLINKLFPSFVDYTTINRFTIPERAEELNAK